MYLRQQADQWRLLEQSAEKHDNGVSQIMEQILRGGVAKANVFGTPIPDRMLRDWQLLDPRRRLLRIKLPVTPPLVAIQCVEWMEGCLQTQDAVNPIFHFLKKMEVAIRTCEPAAWSRVYEDAENQVFFLIELYTLGVTSLIEGICAASQVIPFALVYSNFGQTSSPELFKKLVDHDSRLSIGAEALKIVLAEHLPGMLPSQELIDVSESVRLEVAIACDSVNPVARGAVAREQASFLAQAREEVKRLLSQARATASLSSCGRDAAALPTAQMKLIKCVTDAQLYNRLVIRKVERELREEHDG